MTEQVEKNERIFNVVGGYFCGYLIAFEDFPEDGLLMTVGFANVPGRPDPIYHLYRIDGADLLYCGESLDPVKSLKEHE